MPRPRDAQLQEPVLRPITRAAKHQPIEERFSHIRERIREKRKGCSEFAGIVDHYNRLGQLISEAQNNEELDLSTDSGLLAMKIQHKILLEKARRRVMH